MNTNYRILLCLSLGLFFSQRYVLAQVAINSDGSQPHASAMLDVKANDKGFLLPRMTYTERNAIQSPEEGLMIFCTDCGIEGALEIYLGTGWKAVNTVPDLPPNTAPSVSDVSQSGFAYVNFTLSGIYTYSDADGDPEGTSIYKWYRADNTSGLNEEMITGANNSSYTLVEGDNLKFVRFAVIPVALTGPSPGTEGKASVYTGPITSFNCPASITDGRDAKSYTTILIGNQCWMKENINIGLKIEGSQTQTNNSSIEKYCYNDLESNCDLYGGLYQWSEMMNYTPSSNTNPSGRIGICIEGWHIPSFDEWQQLITYLGGGSIAGGAMKEEGTSHWTSPNTGATNSSGFTALPGGSAASGTYSDLGLFGNFWTTLESTNTSAYDLFLSNEYSTASLSTLNKNTGGSVRCLKNY